MPLRNSIYRHNGEAICGDTVYGENATVLLHEDWSKYPELKYFWVI